MTYLLHALSNLFSFVVSLIMVVAAVIIASQIIKSNKGKTTLDDRTISFIGFLIGTFVFNIVVGVILYFVAPGIYHSMRNSNYKNGQENNRQRDSYNHYNSENFYRQNNSETQNEKNKHYYENRTQNAQSPRQESQNREDYPQWIHKEDIPHQESQKGTETYTDGMNGSSTEKSPDEKISEIKKTISELDKNLEDDSNTLKMSQSEFSSFDTK